ncbi:hypothetical protein [Neobacillus sp. LXY-4]|uniref:hypothetical protein n=1 Tax=Neobacillus sp. LXY-4 TaxID=3379826 RepID=UPI003EE1DF08
MKILVMGFTKIKYMPYMNFYIENIDCEENEVHLIYWNRDCKNESKPSGKIIYHELSLYQEDDVKKYKKILNFYRYRHFVLNVLKEERFDLVIVLHSIPGVLICDYLTRAYKGKYILDYRDYTYEFVTLYKRIINKLVNNSHSTFVSSNAFREILPISDKIFTSHNLLVDSLNHRNAFAVRDLPIRISFWGFIRHEEINREIIKKLANDRRFELHFYGREQTVAINLKNYAGEIEAKNVFFHGEYKPNDRYEFAKSTSIIHNLYDNEVKQMAVAMANKYYDGIIFRIPQVCNLGSYMGEEVTRAGVGLACDPYSDRFADKIFEYYTNLDSVKFTKNCDMELNRVMDEYNAGITVIKKATFDQVNKNEINMNLH